MEPSGPKALRIACRTYLNAVNPQFALNAQDLRAIEDAAKDCLLDLFIRTLQEAQRKDISVAEVLGSRKRKRQEAEEEPTAVKKPRVLTLAEQSAELRKRCLLGRPIAYSPLDTIDLGTGTNIDRDMLARFLAGDEDLPSEHHAHVLAVLEKHKI